LNGRSIAVALSVIALLTPARAVAQATRAWTPPRTADGQPDLQGMWTNATLTPLERPKEFANKPFLTKPEAAEYEKRILQQWDRDSREGTAGADLSRAYGSVWWGAGTKLVPTTRTSLIVDPPDGRIPYRPEALKSLEEARAAARTHAFDGPENRSLPERCLLWPTTGPPMIPSFSNNNAPFGPLVYNYQMIQIPGYVVLYHEVIHDVRVIPLDGRPHLPQGLRQWLGDSRGRWEGNTLVIDTTNFTDKSRFKGSTQNLHLVERLTPVNADTILYEFTVDDPSTYTHPWKAEIPMIRSPGPMLEFACHEGNYGLAGMLGGARADEKTAAEEAAQKGLP
jgi:hypothetical protein